MNCALVWLPRLSETQFVKVPRLTEFATMLMWATPPGGMVSKMQVTVDGAVPTRAHCPWLEFAATYCAPAGNTSVTRTFRAELPPAETFCSVIRRSIFVPIWIALAGLG